MANPDVDQREIDNLNTLLQADKENPGTHGGAIDPGGRQDGNLWDYNNIRLDGTVDWDQDDQRGYQNAGIKPGFIFCGWRIIEESVNNASWSSDHISDTGFTINYKISSSGSVLNQTRGWLHLRLQYRAYLAPKRRQDIKCANKFWSMNDGSRNNLAPQVNWGTSGNTPHINTGLPVPCNEKCLDGKITVEISENHSEALLMITDLLCISNPNSNTRVFKIPKGVSELSDLKICLNSDGYGQLEYSWVETNTKSFGGVPRTRSSWLKSGDVLKP